MDEGGTAVYVTCPGKGPVSTETKTLKVNLNVSIHYRIFLNNSFICGPFIL